ncbi:hypothetical protein C8R44DRAFT_875450 [Mycena epipterygia]|nr:hypothetical protein C8R44DRAFT_875450 [Mycena epipterygia]
MDPALTQPNDTPENRLLSIFPKDLFSEGGAHKRASNVPWDLEVHPPSLCSVPQSASAANDGTHLPSVHFAALGKSSFAGRAVQLDSDYSGSVVVYPIFFVHFVSSENICRRRADTGPCVSSSSGLGRLESVSFEVFER